MARETAGSRMGSWKTAFLLAAVLTVLPCAAAESPRILDPTTVGPQTFDPTTKLEWDIASASSCDEAEGTFRATTLGATRGLHNSHFVRHHCRQWKLAAATALAPVPIAAGTAGFLLAEPTEAHAYGEASAHVDAIGVRLSTAPSEAPRYSAAPSYAPPLASGTLEAPRIGASPDGPRAGPLQGGGPAALVLDGSSEAPAAPAPRARAPDAVAPARDAPTPGAVALAIAGGAALAVLAALLYQRFAPHEALRHPGRAAVFEAVKANEGASGAAIARATSMPRKTAEYHLFYLARAGLVREHVGVGAPRRWTTSAGRAQPTASDALLALVRAHPGLSTARLAELAGLTRTRVDRRVKEFAVQGALEVRSVDGERRFYAR